MATRARRLRAGALLLALAVLAACGGGGRDPLEIGIKRIALDLAFKDESKADPVPPARIIEVIGADPELLDDIVQEPDRIVRGRTGPTLPPAAPACGVAGPEDFPKKPVTVLFQGAPRPGIYTLHNGGTVKVGSGALRFSLPFPSVSTYEVKNVVVTPGIPPDFPEPARSLADPGPTVTYDLVKQIGFFLTVTDSYKYTKSELTLTKRVTVAKSISGTATSTNTFTPTPAVVLASMTNGDGDTWTSAGTDRDTNTGMVVQGAVETNEPVDLCGEKYDSWRVHSTENTVNLTTNEQSSTDAQAPNIYHFANHLAGLMIQEEGHYTQTIIIDGSPVTLEYDFVSTFDSVEPRPKK